MKKTIALFLIFFLHSSFATCFDNLQVDLEGFLGKFRQNSTVSKDLQKYIELLLSQESKMDEVTRLELQNWTNSFVTFVTTNNNNRPTDFDQQRYEMWMHLSKNQLDIKLINLTKILEQTDYSLKERQTIIRTFEIFSIEVLFHSSPEPLTSGQIITGILRMVAALVPFALQITQLLTNILTLKNYLIPTISAEDEYLSKILTMLNIVALCQQLGINSPDDLFNNFRGKSQNNDLRVEEIH